MTGPAAAAGRLVDHVWAGALLKGAGGSVVGTSLVLHYSDEAMLALPAGSAGAVTLRVRALPSKSGAWPRLAVVAGGRADTEILLKPSGPLPVPAERLGNLSLNDVESQEWPVTEIEIPAVSSAASGPSIRVRHAGDGTAGSSTSTVIIERASCRARGGGPGAPAHVRRGRVLVIGIDGLGIELLERVVATRTLPTFERLMTGGARGPLLSEMPTTSPALWNTIITGKAREKHGILDFTVDSPRGPVPVNGTFRRTATLWDVFQAAGRRTTVINWWTSWPAHSLDPDSVLVSDGYVRDPGVSRGVFPASVQSRLPAGHAAAARRYLARLPHYKDAQAGRRLGEAKDDARYSADWRMESNLSDLYAFAQEDFDVAAIATAVRARASDLTAVYFRGFDPVAHFFGEYSNAVAFARPGQPLPPASWNVLPGYLQMLDGLIAGVIRDYGIDPSKDHVLLLSDHGSTQPTMYPVRGYRPNYLFRELGWLDWLYGRDSNWDPERTAVFSGDSVLPDAQYYAPIQENLKTRKFQPFGLPEADRARRERVMATLRSLTTVSGRRLFTAVTEAEAMSDESSALLGTLFFNTAVTGDDVVVFKGRTISLKPYVYDLKTHADHQLNGFFVLAGPSVLRGRFEGLRIADVVPTLLALSHMPVARDLDGRVAEELFLDSVSRNYPWIDTYDAAIRRGPGREFAVPDKEYLDRLRSLGYLR